MDELPAQDVGASPNRLEDRRRGPVFEEALQAAVGGHDRVPVIVVNRDLRVPATQVDERAVPPGATLVRIYLTRWSNASLGSFAVDEVRCRIFAEVRRDGRAVARLGPFLGRNPYALNEATTRDGRYLAFRDAARLAIEKMAQALPR